MITRNKNKFRLDIILLTVAFGFFCAAVFSLYKSVSLNVNGCSSAGRIEDWIYHKGGGRLSPYYTLYISFANNTYETTVHPTELFALTTSAHPLRSTQQFKFFFKYF